MTNQSKKNKKSNNKSRNN